ncbi:uncharacterized protein B0T23DRAFT_154340 [Neurospora hispaniola]|uniref:Uncharacterized protein n=1 Tax=Neurospora hispaniola TaxID=588809 RepID=A0AAJ0I8W1_9PEZI|nr:hypothetical protein B0T23DRAFT_154340 [Neurospora hispaniola]
MLPLNNIILQSHVPLRLQQLDLLAPSAGPLSIPSAVGEGIRKAPGLPGIRCSTCAANGEVVWVIPGRACGFCRTPAMRD